MAELRVRTIDESELDTVLAQDIDFEGTIEFAEPLLVKGRVRGDIKTPSDLFIADGARVNADITAARVSVKGTVQGDVNASERVELFSGAAIVGNVATPDLIVQSGSHFTGRCEMPGGPDGAPAGEGASGDGAGGSGDTGRDATTKGGARSGSESDEGGVH
ncbi:MAG: polymer-forming cytoskeletal protein [Alkalispirochaeta sp.]